MCVCVDLTLVFHLFLWFCYYAQDAASKGLVITSTPNQDNPLMTAVVDKPCIPVLGLDVWEHAYYLK